MRLFAFERHREQTGESTVVADEIGPIAVLDDATMIEDHDLVDRVQRGQSMGDDQRRATPHQIDDGRLEAPFGLRVDTSGRLIEHEQVGVTQPHASERQKLRLARRQSGATRAERALDATVRKRSEADALQRIDRRQHRWARRRRG